MNLQEIQRRLKDVDPNTRAVLTEIYVMQVETAKAVEIISTLMERLVGDMMKIVHLNEETQKGLDQLRSQRRADEKGVSVASEAIVEGRNDDD